MIKKSVLDVIFEPIFDMWGMKIVYQNENILKRGEFKDNGLGVYSYKYPTYNKASNTLYIKGDSIKDDDTIIILSDEDRLKVEDKINKINEKYYTYGFFRVKKNENYYFITSEFEIQESEETYHKIDDDRNMVGNYFYIEEEAIECLNYLKNCLIDWHRKKCVRK